MRIKNKKANSRYFGFRCLRTGFNLKADQTSGELPINVAMDKGCQFLAQRGDIDVILNDNDRRLLGKDTIAKLKPAKAVKTAIPAEVKKVEEPVVVEEPVAEVAGPCEAAPDDEPEVCDGMPVVEDDLETPDPAADEKAVEPAAFSLPKPPSKMTKADWLAIGMKDEIGLRNEINPGMTKTKLQDAVMARLEELGLV